MMLKPSSSLEPPLRRRVVPSLSRSLGVLRRVKNVAPPPPQTATPAVSVSPPASSADATASADIAAGMTVAESLRHFSKRLSSFEKSEILDYNKKIYTCGSLSARRKRGGDADAPNRGFDDERGSYIFSIRDHIAYRYEITGVLGGGSFGTVVKGRDARSGRSVALKIIRNKRRLRQQGVLEVRILQKIGTYDKDLADGEATHGESNASHTGETRERLARRQRQQRTIGHASGAVHLQDSFDFRNHLVLVFPLLGCNLYEYIKAHGHRGSSISTTRRFAEQIASCLVHLRSLHLIHCDLKPENIMLKSPNSLNLRVIDFGSSCEDGQTTFTYIQSRFYRAPEVVLGLPYSHPIDMWSFGCIVAEILTGWPIFPGADEYELLLRIQEVMGMVPRDVAQRSPKKARYFNDGCTSPRSFTSKRGGKKRVPGHKNLRRDCLRGADAEIVDFVSRCLRIDPAERMEPEGAMEHPFLRKETRSRLPAVATKARKTLSKSFRSSDDDANHLPHVKTH